MVVLFRSTWAQRGGIAALTLAIRMVGRKIPLLLRQMRAAGRGSALRTRLAERRANSAGAPLNLAIAVTGGLGDMLVVARFLRDFVLAAGDLHIDIFSPAPELARWAFGGLAGFGGSYHDFLFDSVLGDYDLALRASQFVVVYREHVQWAALRRNPELANMVGRILKFRPKIDAFVERHPYLDNYLAQFATFQNATRRDFLHTIASLPYGGDRLALTIDRDVTQRLRLRGNRYITVHNGFDTGFVISGKRATKCYPHFGAVVTLLREKFGDIQFVQIGSATSDPIHECDINLLNRTSFAEVAAIIEGAELHLDNEGGLVHVASCLGTRSAVVFGPTPAGYFGYPGNINLAPPVCGNCWWMKPTWMDVCAKGYEQPLCMTEQAPRSVAAAIMRAFNHEEMTHHEALPGIA